VIQFPLLEVFKSKHVVVIGDVMIDKYLIGSVDRISPEAPVPVVSLHNEENRLGGAANVALNLRALGANVTLCSVVGDDQNARLLFDLLSENTIYTDGILFDESRMTTVKTRVVSGRQQLLRIDSETSKDISESTEKKLIDKMTQLLEKKVDAIIFQDYNKGVLTDKVIEEVIQLAKRNNVLTTVDPKKKNFLSYRGVTLFKPNLKELREGLNVSIDVKDWSTLNKAVNKLEELLMPQVSFVTLSENGVFIKDAKESHHISAQMRDIADVSGAGDTVIALATLCLSAGLPLKMIAALSNLAGGLVCEKPGVVCVDAKQLMMEAQKNQYLSNE
jgi:D-glycero-beta-D-manno-heptose-7-phosphate kinase